MATTPTHESDRRPFWEVQAVFDPDGGGAEFAYTIGLHTRGLPELHLWARPSLGDDPGSDWMLSVRDRCQELNELAGLLVDGRLHVGDEVVREYDGGLTRVRYRVDPPGDREELEALGVPPGVDVLPVRWSLHRPAEGALGPLGAESEEVASRLFEEIVRDLPGQVRAPRGWALPDEPSFAPDQRFGPLTPVVLARAAQLWQADDDTIVSLLRTAALVKFGYSLNHAGSVALTLARSCGRSAVLAELHERVEDLVERLTLAPVAGRRWRAICRAVDPAWWEQVAPAERRRLPSSYARLLQDVTLACLTVEAVADVAPPALLLEGRGPWVAGLADAQVPPDAAWAASTAVVHAVDGLLVELGLHGREAVARMHRLAMTVRVEGLDGYPDLCSRLMCWATVSAAVYPRRLLDRLPAGDLPTEAGGNGVGGLEDLHDWATCVASALTHRGRLSAEDVRVLSYLPGELLPRLEEVLNSPL